MAYTPPARNAVNFSGGAPYTPPARNAVSFTDYGSVITGYAFCKLAFSGSGALNTGVSGSAYGPFSFGGLAFSAPPFSGAGRFVFSGSAIAAITASISAESRFVFSGAALVERYIPEYYIWANRRYKLGGNAYSGGFTLSKNAAPRFTRVALLGVGYVNSGKSISASRAYELGGTGSASRGVSAQGVGQLPSFSGNGSIRSGVSGQALAGISFSGTATLSHINPTDAIGAGSIRFAGVAYGSIPYAFANTDMAYATKIEKVVYALQR